MLSAANSDCPPQHRATMIARDLPAAVARGELFLVYQPVCQSNGARVVALEALLRWKHPVLGLVPPDEFIPVAEVSGWIDQIGEWVLRTACAQACAWPKDVSVAVNVSGFQLTDDFPYVVASVLERTGLPGERLELEITETSLVDLSQSRPALQRLRALGVRIALDDLGAGYSGLSRVIEVQPDGLKLDRSITERIDSNRDAAVMVRAIAGFCQEIGMTLTIEGIERLEQFVILKQLPSCRLQGYFFSRAVDADEVEGFLDRWQRAAA